MLGLTYANEWEDYTITDEALNDPTFRDELIALGLDPETGEGRGRLSALLVDAGRNTTDNLLDAKKGYVASVHLETAGQWLGGDFDYREVSAEGRYFQAIGSRAVVAVQGRAGSIDSSGPEETLVPFFKRYFLGGATNLRGWGRYEVSPLSDGSSDRRPHVHELLDRGARPAGWQARGGVVPRRRQRLDQSVGLQPQRPALRRGAWAPLQHADWSVSPRPRLAAQPDPGLLVNGEPQTRRMRIHFSIGQAF